MSIEKSRTPTFFLPVYAGVQQLDIGLNLGSSPVRGGTQPSHEKQFLLLKLGFLSRQKKNPTFLQKTVFIEIPKNQVCGEKLVSHQKPPMHGSQKNILVAMANIYIFIFLFPTNWVVGIFDIFRPLVVRSSGNHLPDYPTKISCQF